MIRSSRASTTLMAAALLMAACAAPSGPRPGPAAQERAGSTASQSRVLTIAARQELAYLIAQVGGTDPLTLQRPFNASFTLNDDSGSVRPYLAEVLPQLNTDTWRVFPDGRMETTYKLRSGLTWHDGQPLQAEDFVFARRVYTNPNLSIFAQNLERLRQMEAVVAADPRTLVIRWRSPYPDADRIQMGDFDPLPGHILGQSFASVEQDPAGADVFLRLPFWRAEYVSAGPYKLVHWESGSHFEGAAFDGHALGRPKIDRIIVRPIEDDNVVLTNILAGNLEWAAVRFQQGQLLQRDWVPAGNGVVRLVRTNGGPQIMMIQQRPEYVGQPALLDIRVRRALAHSLDRQSINEGLFEGQGLMTETFVAQTEPFFPEVDRAIMLYPYDPHRTEQLMNEVGFAKDRDGFFADAAGKRFRFDFLRGIGSDLVKMHLIQMDTWQRAGIEVQPSNPPPKIEGDPDRYTFPGILVKGSVNERTWLSTQIGAPENRWAGTNFTGWSNAEYDRLWEAFTTTLDRAERTRQYVQMQRVLSEDLPVFFTNFGLDAQAHVAALHGPTGESTGTGAFTPTTLRMWNIHEWEWQ